MQTIKALKTSKSEGFWIEAKGSLPEPGIAVGVITSGGKREVCECSPQDTRAEFTDGAWKIVWYFPISSGGKRDGEAHHMNRITHWMFFPQAPVQMIQVK